MAQGTNYLVKNLDHKPCKKCGGDHEFFSRASANTRCGIPVAFSREVADGIAKAEDLDPSDAVVVVPDDTIVILDDSARKLKKQSLGSVPFEQSFTTLHTF